MPSFGPLGAQAIGEIQQQNTSTIINCSVGCAAAAGALAALLFPAIIAATPGNATATGQPATITQSGLTTISCLVGNAAAGGLQAIIAAGYVISCGVGTAYAGGPLFSITKIISCQVGAAAAAGVQAQIVTGDMAEYQRSAARTYAIGTDETVDDEPTFKRSPSARLDYSFDWAAYLADTSDGVAAYDIAVGDQLVKGNSFLNGQVATVWIEPGGVAGYKQPIRCDITTSQGRKDSRTIWLNMVAAR